MLALKHINELLGSVQRVLSLHPVEFEECPVCVVHRQSVRLVFADCRHDIESCRSQYTDSWRILFPECIQLSNSPFAIMCLCFMAL